MTTGAINQAASVGGGAPAGGAAREGLGNPARGTARAGASAGSLRAVGGSAARVRRGGSGRLYSLGAVRLCLCFPSSRARELSQTRVSPGRGRAIDLSAGASSRWGRGERSRDPRGSNEPLAAGHAPVRRVWAYGRALNGVRHQGVANGSQRVWQRDVSPRAPAAGEAPCGHGATALGTAVERFTGRGTGRATANSRGSAGASEVVRGERRVSAGLRGRSTSTARERWVGTRRTGRGGKWDGGADRDVAGPSGV